MASGIFANDPIELLTRDLSRRQRQLVKASADLHRGEVTSRSTIAERTLSGAYRATEGRVATGSYPPVAPTECEVVGNVEFEQ